MQRDGGGGRQGGDRGGHGVGERAVHLDHPDHPDRLDRLDHEEGDDVMGLDADVNADVAADMDVDMDMAGLPPLHPADSPVRPQDAPGSRADTHGASGGGGGGGGGMGAASPGPGALPGLALVPHAAGGGGGGGVGSGGVMAGSGPGVRASTDTSLWEQSIGGLEEEEGGLMRSLLAEALEVGVRG